MKTKSRRIKTLLESGCIRLPIDTVIKYVFAGRARFNILHIFPGYHFDVAYKVVFDKRRKQYYVYAGEGKKLIHIGTVWVDNNLRIVITDGTITNLVSEYAPGWLFRTYIDWLNSGLIPEHLVLWRSTTCARCGRPLTDPISKKLGFGPKCAKKTGVQ